MEDMQIIYIHERRVILRYKIQNITPGPALEWPFEVAVLAPSQRLVVSCALPLPCPTDGHLRIHQQQRHLARSRVATGHLRTRYVHGAYAAGGSRAHRRHRMSKGP